MAEKISDYVPPLVLTEIGHHLRDASLSAEQGWESARADEDTLTGDLGASLRVGWRSVNNGVDEFQWRIKYSKFRGRGEGAEESVLGADGIFQIEIEDVVSGALRTKGLLFQAKKHTNRDRKELLKQTDAMNDLVPGGACVIEYGPTSYQAFNATSVLHEDGVRTGRDRLGDYLAGQFLPCLVGKWGLYYEVNRNVLVLPDASHGYQRVRARLKHSFRIEVQRNRED